MKLLPPLHCITRRLRCLPSVKRSMGCVYRLLLVVLLFTRSIDGRSNGRSPDSPSLRHSRAAGDDCFWNLTVRGSGGTLSSPEYPKNYPSNADCRWLLTSNEPNSSIFLRIDSLNIEPDTDCKLDYLQVYLGPTSLSPALGPFCGTINDRVIKTNSSQLLVVFHSDPIYEDKGFSIDYFTQTTGDCQTLLTDGSGSLRSPGFPENYPDNTDCWTQITVSPGKKVILFFDSLDMEYGDNCTFDYVQIFDGATRNATLLGQVCRHIGLMNFESSSNTILLHFHSDDSVNKKGYRARYSSVDKRSTPIGDCLWESDDNNGTIASPNYPAKYPGDSNCTIWIQAPEGSRIFITFDALQLEMETNCSYDYLQIKEGPSESKVLGTYCGRRFEPKNLTTEQSEVEIRFVSDDMGEFSGFKMRYWFLKNDTEAVQSETSVDTEPPQEPEKLMFSQVPQNATLDVGSSYMLHCSTQHPNAKIRWLKGEQYLAAGSPIPGLRVLSNGTLWIQSMDHHLAGIYSCIAVAPEDTVTARAYILVRNAPNDGSCGIVFRKTPKDSSFAEGEFAHLECLAAGPSVRLSWHKDGRPLNPGPHVTIIKNGFIFMDKVQLQDAGVYSCVAEDTGAGCTRKASALLQVSKRVNIDEICGRPKFGKPSVTIPQMDHGKILGGHNAKKGAYPWQVMLWEPNLKSFCGGSLLNERWIATAAHCFIYYNNLRWDRVVIKLGKYDREMQEEQEFRTGIADPSSIVVHPDYNKVTFDNDLALVRLRDHVGFTDYIQPLCLADVDLSESLLNGIVDDTNKIRMGTVVGWGKLKDHGPSPRYLQEIALPVIDQNVCVASTNYTVSRNMFCAGYAQEILGDACQGDSGGPFMMAHRDKWHLIGIVSWGESCGMANKYGFYTRIPNYIPWIKGIIKS